MKLEKVEKTEKMSSREIAELFNKPHNNVLKKIRLLETAYIQGFGNEGNFYLVKYTDSKGESRPEFLLNKSQALFVASRFDATLHAKVQKRWEELEKKQTITPDMLLNPDIIIQLATNLKQEQEQRRLAENTLNEAKPKIEFAERLEASEDTILIGTLAKIINQTFKVNIGQNRFFEWLRDNDYLMKEGSRKNLPTQKSIDLKIMVIQEREIDGRIRVTTKITTKGQRYFLEIFAGEQWITV